MESTDALGEFDQVLATWEAKTPGERTENNIIDDVLTDWLGREFSKEVKKHTALKTKSLQWCQKDAYINQQFARAVEILAQDWDVSGEERKKQIEKGFLAKRKQIEGIIGKEAMVGWMSNITFIHLLDSVDPNDRLRLPDCFAKPHDDARNGIDFSITLVKGDAATVNLIQLKTNGSGGISVERFDEKSLEGYGVWAGSRLFDRAVAERFIAKRNEILENARKEGKAVNIKCFTVEVPSFDSPVTMDTFGRVKDDSVKKRFAEECFAAGLYERG